MRARRPIGLLAILALAACSSRDTPASPAATIPDISPPVTVAPPTTAPAASTTVVTTAVVTAAPEPADDRSVPGPYPVGVTTLAAADGSAVEVWYPAVAGTTGSVAYDVRD